jgi:hypothetical protein
MSNFIKRYEEESEDEFRYKSNSGFDEVPKSEHSSTKSDRDVDRLEKFLEDLKI